MVAPQVKIGYPHDPLKTVKEKEQTLNNLLSSRARAWHGYLSGLSLAYNDAYKQHVKTLNDIKEQIKNQNELMRKVIFGTLLPSVLGGGMAALLSGKGEEIVELIYPVATRNEVMLNSFATTGLEKVNEKVQEQVMDALKGLVPEPGSEWDAVADDPLKFFLRLDKMVDDFTTDVIRDVESAKHSTLENYKATVNAYLLSPFIQNAPMDTDVLYRWQELSPVFEIFLWVVWAKARDVKYWLKQVNLATEPDDRSFVGKIWDGVTLDDHAQDLVAARQEVKRLDPIMDRLFACGIQPHEIAQAYGNDHSHRFLNILWVRFLGIKHPNSLLYDLTANLDSKSPTSAIDGKPLNKFRRLK